MMGALEDQLADLSKALWSHHRHIGGGGDGPHVDGMSGPVVAFVAQAIGRLVEQPVAEAIFPGLERLRDADEQRRILLGIARLIARGDESADAAAGVHVNTQRLDRADHNISAVVDRGGEHPERNWIDADNRLGTRRAGNGGNLGSLPLDHAKIRWHLEIDCCGIVAHGTAQVVQIDQAGCRIIVDKADCDVVRHLGRLAIIADDGQALWIDGAHYRHLVASGEPRGHAHRMPGSAAPTAHRQTNEIEVEQLTKLAAELEPRLVAAVIGTGLAENRSDPLVAADDLVDRGGHMVLPDTSAKEIQIVLCAAVLGEDPENMAAQFLLAQRRRQLERTGKAMILRDLHEQFLDSGNTDRIQHLLLNCRHRIGYVGMC